MDIKFKLLSCQSTHTISFFWFSTLTPAGIGVAPHRAGLLNRFEWIQLSTHAVWLYYKALIYFLPS